MHPGKSGWLPEYLEFRKVLLKDYQNDKKKSAHPEQALYKIIQPTGLMYGQSVTVLEHPDANQWNEKDRMKILLAESLIGSSILFYDKPIKDEADLNKIIQQTTESISNFYNHVFPELATAGRTWFGKKKTPIELAEQILEKRIERSAAHANNFWINFFHNSLLFLDIYIFGQWIHTQGDRVVSDFFKFQREELRFSVVKIITSAAHANHTVEFEERKLLEYFLQSAGLSADKKKEALDIFEQGVEIEGLDLPTSNSWILRKYFLEMAILTIWSDKQVEENEMNFLRRLAKHLNFHDDDTENSLIALEGFILQHWEELTHLQNKKAFQQVSDQFIKRLARVVEIHKARLLKEARSSNEMMTLIKKAQSAELKADAKERLSELLITALRTIPNFAVVSLPQKFLTLPVLMKILPNNFFSEVLN
jgi:hypothetical protein